jgi:hypothetical protein
VDSVKHLRAHSKGIHAELVLSSGYTYEGQDLFPVHSSNAKTHVIIQHGVSVKSQNIYQYLSYPYRYAYTTTGIN